jgi:hypothetical protein
VHKYYQNLSQKAKKNRPHILGPIEIFSG